MSIKVSVKQMVDEANANIDTISVVDAKAALDDDNTVIVDIRDIRELYREGKIPGALHAPRGMLEFWVDPDSEYHREVFSSGKRFALYCAKSHRSALATQTLQNMGLTPICHIGGGFEAWKNAEMPIEDVPKK
ncbi:MAG: rhodanese-like domain-containing protein [Porticoccaceae bacterium]|nr:rhodanese-like domain-containing protein [Porticoccaceae bacterium]